MTSTIWAIDDILKFADQADRILSLTIQGDNPDEIVDRIAALISLYPSSASALSSAEYWRHLEYRKASNEVYQAYMQKTGDDKFKNPLASPSVMKDYINSRIAEFHAMETRMNRINAAITHSMEAMRSILSHLKEERKIQNYSSSM